MAIKFRVIEVNNKLNNKSKMLAYATQVSNQRVEINELSQMISERSAVSRADVKSVLDNLSWISKFLLMNGMRVSLGDLGSLSLRVRSKAADSKENFGRENLKVPSIKFYPGQELREGMRSISFNIFDPDAVAKGKDDPKGDHPAFEDPEEKPDEPTEEKPTPEEGGDTNAD